MSRSRRHIRRSFHRQVSKARKEQGGLVDREQVGVEEEDEEEEGGGHVDIVWCDVLAGPSVTAVTCDGVLCLPVMSLPALQLPVR